MRAPRSGSGIDVLFHSIRTYPTI